MLERLLRAYEWMHANRRRWVPLLVVVGALVVGREVLGSVPSEVDVELPIGAAHADVERIDVAYLEQGELVHHVSLRFPGGAPESVRHRVELAPGAYVVAVDLVRDDGVTESRSGRLDAPAEGRVRLALHEGGT